MKPAKSIAVLRRVADQERLHLDDVAHRQAEALERRLDCLQDADGLRLGVAEGRGAVFGAFSSTTGGTAPLT